MVNFRLSVEYKGAAKGGRNGISVACHLIRLILSGVWSVGVSYKFLQ